MTTKDAEPAMFVPRSGRGQRTRAALLTAARTIFERDGFLDARIVDITAEAGVSAGSFYTYFPDKDALFAALVEQTREEMLYPTDYQAPAGNSPVEALREANRAYLDAYRRNRKLMRVFEQVAMIDERFRDMRRDRALAFARRNAKTIARLQADGRADDSVDPMMASIALGAMVSRMAFLVYVVEIMEVDFDQLVDTATHLWANALKMNPG